MRPISNYCPRPVQKSFSIVLSTILQLWTDLDPGDVGGHAEARGPAEGVEDVALAGIAAAALQLLHVGLGRGQHSQDPPQDQEVVLQRAGLLGPTTHKAQGQEDEPFEMLRFILQSLIAISILTPKSTFW